jgi:hypothetical protein
LLHFCCTPATNACYPSGGWWGGAKAAAADEPGIGVAGVDGLAGLLYDNPAACATPDEASVLFPISHADWQVLRAALRAGSPLFGRELRLTPNRRTKEATSLDALVAAGLLLAVGKPEAADGRPGEPIQLRTRYRLTAFGEHATEYGEYERAFAPEEKPVGGWAAELLADLAARKAWGQPAPRKPSKKG